MGCIWPCAVAWALLTLSCNHLCAFGQALRTFDDITHIRQHSEQIPSTSLAEALALYSSILTSYNKLTESHALQQYLKQLSVVQQPDCCDYFTALATVRSLTAALSEVIALRLGPSLRPVVRRSYVAAIWLLQRSRFFKWDSSSLHKDTVSGMYKLYEQHLNAVAGRPINFHHISKTGGTSLCSVAWENGCRGPGMSKKDNCLLDTGADGPVWVLRHNVTTVNKLTPVPPPPALPPAVDISPEEAERLRLAALNQQRLKRRSFDWWMYDCPADRMDARVGRSCTQLQEGAISKSATFFAVENTLPLEHGKPMVCEAFTNVVMLRDAVSQAVSLMLEVGQVYMRLLKQHRVLGWDPPKWDLAWWQQWAPAVVSSYATRTLLGRTAFCPAATPSPAVAAQAWAAGQDVADSSLNRELLSSRAASTDSSSSGSSGSGSPSAGGTALSVPLEADVQRVLQVLASFDVVLDLHSTDLIDISLKKLLGWAGQDYSTGRHQRAAQVLFAPTWQQLELLARQQPPPAEQPLGGSSGGSSVVQGSSSYPAAEPPSSSLSAARGVLSTQQVQAVRQVGAQSMQQQAVAAASPATDAGVGGNGRPGPAGSGLASDEDTIRRLVAEVRVREVYAAAGMQHALVPVMADVPLLQPPASVVSAAVSALSSVQKARLIVDRAPDGTGLDHVQVRLQLDTQPSATHFSTAATGEPSSQQAAEAQLKAPSKAAAPAGDSPDVVKYHVWPKHGVVLAAAQYAQLEAATAADAVLYRHGRVMQLLDAAWVSVLGQQRKVRKMLNSVQADAQTGSCGFAGLNHLQ